MSQTYTIQTKQTYTHSHASCRRINISVIADRKTVKFIQLTYQFRKESASVDLSVHSTINKIIRDRSLNNQTQDHHSLIVIRSTISRIKNLLIQTHIHTHTYTILCTLKNLTNGPFDLDSRFIELPMQWNFPVNIQCNSF